jgi:hypothetical protein
MKWPKQDAFIPFRQRVIVLEQQQDKEEQINPGKLKGNMWEEFHPASLFCRFL